MSNQFGKFFRISTYGESHGGAVGVVIDGCPPLIPFDLDKVQKALHRRRPGQSEVCSPRNEADRVVCLSGVEDCKTLGTPIHLQVLNQDKKPQDYSDLQSVFRPSHADYTTWAKYGTRAASGGGRSSARETIGRVAAAAVAEMVIEKICPKVEIVAFVSRIKDLECSSEPFDQASRDEIDRHPTRCLGSDMREQARSLILEAKEKGDSLGGVITGVVRHCPVGLGGPVFDKLEADLAKAMLSLPAAKGFEVGSGFSGTYMWGSEHNDAFFSEHGKIRTKTNHSGGIQGGISNGELIVFRVAFKPVSTIFKPQETVDQLGKTQHEFIPASGRHDPCVLPRAVPMVEAMASLVVCDHIFEQVIINSFQQKT